MPLLVNNRRALAARFPELLPSLDAAPAPRRVTPAPEETPEIVASVAAMRRTLLVLTGVPGLQTGTRLLRSAPREIVFWCVEPDTNALAARLASADYSAWLGDPRVFLSLGPPSPAQTRRLNRELAWVDGARAVPLPTRCATLEDPWRSALATTLARLQQRWQSVYTDVRISPHRFENTCRNLDVFLPAPTVDALAGAFAGAPLVLVAAGPSLDDALPFLAAARERALVVTGNTSFRALANRGLPPHLTVSIDPFATTDLGYEGQSVDQTFLVAPVFGYPSVLHRFAGRLFGLTDESTLLQRVRPGPAPALLGEGTVSATILNLARHLGCRDVFLVGQDFAIAGDGRTHAADTFYTDLGCNRHDGEQVHALPGTTQDRVTVPGRHLWYLRIVEELIARDPARRVHNLSARGAAIAGAPYLPAEQALAALAAFPPRDFAAELRRLHATPSPEAAGAAAATTLRREAAEAGDSLRHALAAALAGEVACHAPSPENRQRFAVAGNRFETWRSALPARQAMLFEGRTKAEIFSAERRRCAVPAGDPLQPLREATETAWAFAEGSAFLHRQLTRAVENTAT